MLKQAGINISKIFSQFSKSTDIMRLTILIFFGLILIFTACGETKPGPHIVDVTATEYYFDAPDTIEAGWTTFNMVNEGTEEHFMLINPISDSTSLKDVRQTVAWVQGLHDDHESAIIDKGTLYQVLGEKFPPTENVQYAGGVGLLSPGHEASATTFLEPGRYILECYVRNEQGVQHNHLGMIRELVVKETDKVTNPPEADYTIAITNNGISHSASLESGIRTFKVYFNEHPEGYVGNDVHVYRSKARSYIELKKWMDVFEKDGMVGPAPVTFIGGTQEVTARGVAYFTVDLEPGELYSISEKGVNAPGNRAHFVVE